jgi:hypothetical protein
MFGSKFVHQGSLNLNQLIPDDAFVRVIGQETKKLGLFKLKVVIYELETEPVGWRISRKFFDFTWLANTLKTLYPDSLIPSLPVDSKMTFDDPEMAERLLLRFINAVVVTPLLATSSVVLDFLRESDNKRWEEIKSSKIKMEKPTTLASYIGAREKLHIDPEPVTPDLTNRLNEFISGAKASTVGLDRSARALVGILHKMSEALDGIANEFGALSDA